MQSKSESKCFTTFHEPASALTCLILATHTREDMSTNSFLLLAQQGEPRAPRSILEAHKQRTRVLLLRYNYARHTTPLDYFNYNLCHG
jgi:hypothetical protein